MKNEWPRGSSMVRFFFCGLLVGSALVVAGTWGVMAIADPAPRDDGAFTRVMAERLRDAEQERDRARRENSILRLENECLRQLVDRPEKRVD